MNISTSGNMSINKNLVSTNNENKVSDKKTEETGMETKDTVELSKGKPDTYVSDFTYFPEGSVPGGTW
ncbi:MAG: hypothetical protein AB9903_25205 [Vulcanimicrobiota bacterium]